MRLLTLTRGARLALVALLLLAVAGAVGLARNPSWRDTVHDSLVRRPADVTELYFDPSEPLPAQLQPGVQRDIRYVVANRGRKARGYVVTITYGGTAACGQTTPVVTRLQVPAGGRASDLVVVKPGGAGTCSVVVALSQRQRITFSADVVA
jgi:hypothetical protein